MSERIRVVVADDQNISRGFFEMYIHASARYELAASVRTAQEAVEYTDAHEADLLILDVMMQEGIDGLTAAGEIKRKHPALKIILTTSTSETSWEEKARAIGVESFWYKEYDDHSFLDVLDRTADGESVYPTAPPQVNFGRITRNDLTDRELDVLRELTGSLTNEEIADKLHISANTVKRHLQNIMEKSGFNSRLDLAMHARMIGLVVNEGERTGTGRYAT
ncbi:MAG: response regulator transcription factor [Oscillospiraceae bacterium]|jgi:DNA-binding NarL/FixJ family response regulator|nr:response regulator transcription factor [Oscillospiraceae bacterium]